jgi:phosphate transport system substrate-binding protein
MAIRRVAIKINLLLVLSTVLFFHGCDYRKDDETTTKGSLDVVTDESVAPMIEPQLKEFMRVWQDAKVQNETMTTRKVVERLLNRETRFIIIARDVKADEAAALKTAEIELEKKPIAVDAVCFLVHPENPVTVLTLAQAKDILTGKITDWSEVGGKKQSIQLFITSLNDGQREYLQDSLLRQETFAKSAYPCTSFAQMKNFIPKSQGFFGYTGTGYARPALNVREPDTTAFKTLALSVVRDSGGKVDIVPHQQQVYLGEYPLTYRVYFAYPLRQKLALGFASFLGREGQAVFQKNGFAPYRQPVRIVNFRED